MANAMKILDQGFACLVEHMGVIDTEYFIPIIKRDDFDYTVWQREYFDKMEKESLRQKHLLMPIAIPVQERLRCCRFGFRISLAPFCLM